MKEGVKCLLADINESSFFVLKLASDNIGAATSPVRNVHVDYCDINCPQLPIWLSRAVTQKWFLNTKIRWFYNVSFIYFHSENIIWLNGYKYIANILLKILRNAL